MLIVEIIGGSLDSKEKEIDRFYEYFFFEEEAYYARIIKYEKLGWLYVWYEFSGNAQGSRLSV